MKTLAMIKELCKYNNDTYKKVLVCEFLQDINYHPEAQKVAEKIYNYDLLHHLYVLSNETSYDKKQWNYLNESMDLKSYMGALHTLMTEEGNFRVAHDPKNKNITVSYDAFRSFEKANHEYSVVSRLSDFGLEEGEAEELIKFALNPQQD